MKAALVPREDAEPKLLGTTTTTTTKEGESVLTGAVTFRKCDAVFRLEGVPCDVPLEVASDYGEGPKFLGFRRRRVAWFARGEERWIVRSVSQKKRLARGDGALLESASLRNHFAALAPRGGLTLAKGRDRAVVLRVKKDCTSPSSSPTQKPRRRDASTKSFGGPSWVSVLPEELKVAVVAFVAGDTVLRRVKAEDEEEDQDDQDDDDEAGPHRLSAAGLTDPIALPKSRSRVRELSAVCRDLRALCLRAVTTIRVGDVEAPPAPRRVVDLASRCPNLVALKLRNFETLRDEDLAALTAPTLTVLNLGGCVRVTDRGLQSLAGRLRCLEVLNVAHTAVTAPGLAHACSHFPRLAVLNVYGKRDFLHQEGGPREDGLDDDDDDDDADDALSLLLRHCRHLVALNARETGFTDDHAARALLRLGKPRGALSILVGNRPATAAPGLYCDPLHY